MNDKVITTGDSLFGSTVTSIDFSRQGLNNLGQVAFYATLADGTSGIFRADPQLVPEADALSGVLAFGAFGAGVMLRQRK